jgi:hypothetical protein
VLVQRGVCAFSFWPAVWLEDLVMLAKELRIQELPTLLHAVEEAHSAQIQVWLLESC